MWTIRSMQTITHFYRNTLCRAVIRIKGAHDLTGDSSTLLTPKVQDCGRFKPILFRRWLITLRFNVGTNVYALVSGNILGCARCISIKFSTLD